jgi:DNA-nicking Smr family endonuclease
MTAGGGRRGRLSSEDIELWVGVTRSIKPLRKRAPRVEAPQEAVPTPPAKRGVAAKPVSVPVQAPVMPKAKVDAPPSVTTLDRRTKQKIARGNQTIDARLDLHGHTQAQAHDVLLRFLRVTQSRGGRVALVITGKGGRGKIASGEGTGALKRAVPLWLALPEFRNMVIGFDTAAIGHGGEGALYVRLRKIRE